MASSGCARARLDRFVSALTRDEVLPLDTQAAVLAGKIDADLVRAGRPIGVADVIVAAIALRRELPPVTGNQAHFEYVRDVGYPLHLDNWRTA